MCLGFCLWLSGGDAAKMRFYRSLVALPQLAKTIQIIKAYISEQTKPAPRLPSEKVVCVLVITAVIQCTEKQANDSRICCLRTFR